MTIVRAFSRRAAAAALFLVTALPCTTAMAMPEVGSPTPNLHVADAWDRSISLDGYAGMPILVIYEDRGSSKENDALKKELHGFVDRNHDYTKRVALVPVADVSSFNFGLARGLIKRFIKQESAKHGVDIYCDWDGGFRGTLGLVRKTSNIVLYGSDGKVVFARSGPLSTADRAELIGLLRQQLGEVASVP